MKAVTFPQVKGPLHAKRHLRESMQEKKRAAVLVEMRHPQLARLDVDRSGCTPNFQSLFRDVEPALAHYFEITVVG
jgi:hypothetical protein